MNILIIVNRNFHGLYTPIIEELEGVGHHVELLEIGKVAQFRYKNTAQRLKNFFSRTFLGKNLKQQYRDAMTTAYLKNLAEQRSSRFDLIVVNHPDTCNEEHIDILKTMSHTLGAHLWDSSGKEPKFFRHIDLYDTVISFDPDDVKRFRFQPTTNYLNEEITKLPEPDTYRSDVFSVMSYDPVRYQFIKKLIDANPGVRFDMAIYVQSEHRRKYVTHPQVEVISTPLKGDALLQRISGSRAMLDIGHSGQHGLSFRVFEALGHERKLITTNARVKEYPFYNAENIFCISEDNAVIDPVFFATAYQPVDSGIVSQYRLKQWTEDYLSKLTKGAPFR